MQYKYNEDKSIQLIQKYIDSTYGQHYVGNDGIQTIDVWDSLDMATNMCQGTAIKYLMRFGRKEGYNQRDLLKACHYIILLMHFAEKKQAGLTVKSSKDKNKLDSFINAEVNKL